ncbi:MAG: agmatinase [Candidatus Odinarchaeia archaeon]
MSYRELYCSKNAGFLNSPSQYGEAKYVIVGAPLDLTASFNSGSRFAPESIRRASINLETFNTTLMRDISELEITDIGDIDINYSSIKENISRIEKVIGEIYGDGKIPITLGGEHTVTFGCVKPLKEFTVICFDAHLDLRDEYCGASISHATVMRRILEETVVNKIIFVGTRALSKEEFKIIEENPKATSITIDEIRDSRIQKIINKINKDTKENIYLSIDMDVFDPSIAPSVGNPEPNGLRYDEFYDIIQGVKQAIAGFDICEITPYHTIDITALYASKIIFDLITTIELKKMDNDEK